MTEAERVAAAPRLPLLLVAGYALIVLAWIFGNPPFAAPDEDGHYVRALGVASGDIRGRQTRYTLPADTPADVRAWYARNPEDVRAVRVPRGLMASGVTCEALAPERSAGCLADARPVDAPRVTTLVARYNPAPYGLPGLAARFASSPFTGLRLARVASAILCLLLLALGVAVLWAPVAGAVSLVGAVIALTPMALFSASIVNPSGVEIAAGFAFAAALLRLARGDAPRWAWPAAGAAGATLALSRAPGPAWIVLDALLVAVLVGRPRAAQLLREGARAFAVVGAAIVASVVWSVAFGPRSSVGVAAFVHHVRGAIGVLPFRLREEVGQFGWLDTPMPTLGVMAWQAMLVVLVTLAFAVARARERVALAAAVVVALALPVVFSAWFTALTVIGGAQGRHLLPAVVALPLLAGELLVRNPERTNALRLAPLVPLLFVAAAALQLIAWAWNAHRFAVGSGGAAFFLRAPEWSPPLGWWTWLAVAAVGSALVAVAALARSLPSAR